jgi:ABC-type antimicrobial peptide transport system permease subunit
VVTTAVTPEYFAALGPTLVEGRTFDERPGGDGSVAIVNQAFAVRYLQRGSAVGQLLWPCGNVPPRQVIGVVADRKSNPRLPAPPLVFVPYLDQATRVAGTVVAFAVSTRGPAPDAAPAIVETMASIAPNVPLFELESGSARNERLLAPERTLLTLLALFGGTALLLASVALYGVLSYSIRRRTRELGVRIAVGARGRDLLLLLLRESLVPVAIGLLAGIAGARIAVPFFRGMLYGVSDFDPAVHLAACGALLTASFVAAVVPGIRAGRVDAAAALRAD